MDGDGHCGCLTLRPHSPLRGDATEYADGYRLTRALIPTRAQTPSSSTTQLITRSWRKPSVSQMRPSIATQLIPSTSSRHRATIRGKTQEDQLNGVNDESSLVWRANRDAARTATIEPATG